MFSATPRAQLHMLHVQERLHAALHDDHYPLFGVQHGSKYTSTPIPSPAPPHTAACASSTTPAAHFGRSRRADTPLRLRRETYAARASSPPRGGSSAPRHRSPSAAPRRSLARHRSIRRSVQLPQSSHGYDAVVLFGFTRTPRPAHSPSRDPTSEHEDCVDYLSFAAATAGEDGVSTDVMNLAPLSSSSPWQEAIHGDLSSANEKWGSELVVSMVTNAPLMSTQLSCGSELAAPVASPSGTLLNSTQFVVVSEMSMPLEDSMQELRSGTNASVVSSHSGKDEEEDAHEKAN